MMMLVHVNQRFGLLMSYRMFGRSSAKRIWSLWLAWSNLLLYLGTQDDGCAGRYCVLARKERMSLSAAWNRLTDRALHLVLRIT